MTLGWTFVQFFLLEYLHANPPLIRSRPPLAYCVLALGRVPPTTYAENTLYRGYQPATSCCCDTVLLRVRIPRLFTHLQNSSSWDNQSRSAAATHSPPLLFWSGPPSSLNCITSFCQLHNNFYTVSSLRAFPREMRKIPPTLPQNLSIYTYLYSLQDAVVVAEELHFIPSIYRTEKESLYRLWTQVSSIGGGGGFSGASWLAEG